MAGKLRSLTIIPMGSAPADEVKRETKEDDEKSEDGLRESFDEFMSALESGDKDGAFEALKGFVEQCSMSEY